MKYRLPKDAFHAVKLSVEEQNSLILEAETVVRETIAANEAFLENDAIFQDPQWKSVREKEHLRVYCQRRKSRRSSKAQSDQSPFLPGGTRRLSKCDSRYRGLEESSTNIESSMSTYSAVAENSTMEKMKPANVPLMAVHGTLDGNLDDCLFGCLASTDEAWRLRSSHLRDRLDDSRIIATIKGPKRDDPFRFLGVKWFAQKNPAMLSSIVQQRDFLVVECSGLTHDSEGEKVGYFLIHSIKVRDVPEFSDVHLVRGTMSFCSIFRQSRPGKVTVHSLGFFNSRGGYPSRMAIAGTTEAIISFASVVDYAYTKKLMWLMSHKDSQPGPVDTKACYCQACGKGLTKFLRSGSSGSCRICCLVVCAKCSVIKKMTVDISDTGVVQQCSFRFCLGCLVNAKQQPSSKMVFSDTGRSRREELPTASKSRLIPERQQALDDWIDEPCSGNQRAQTRVRQRMNFARTKYPEQRKISENSDFQTKAAQSLPVHDGTPFPPRIDATQSMRGFRPRAHNKPVHEYLDDFNIQARGY